jgi:hypothetical protein
MAKVLAFFLVTTLLWSCKREEVSPIPAITFINQTTYEVADSGKGESFIFFNFNFEDGDADTGPIGNPQSWQNIYFIDSRTQVESFFDFPPIPADVVTDDGIKGSFAVRMNPGALIARTDTSVHKFTDTVRWRVFVRDAKDNFSNEVMTDSIVIVK